MVGMYDEASEAAKRLHKRARESSGKENKSGNGQRMGAAVSKKRRRKSQARMVPDDGYEGYKLESSFDR